jgi:hypothetical protein
LEDPFILVRPGVLRRVPGENLDAYPICEGVGDGSKIGLQVRHNSAYDSRPGR